MGSRFNNMSARALADMPADHNVKVMVVGDVARWKTLGRLQDVMADYVYVGLHELDDNNIREIAPDLVLSPLMTPAFDAIDVAERLRAAAFSGRYCAVANDVPNVDIIRREVKSIAPQLTFDVLILPAKSGANSD